MRAPRDPAALDNARPFSQCAYVDVTFLGANLDMPVYHDLRAPTHESINYQVVRADRAVSVYHDASPTRSPWTAGVIVLRADVANAVVRLLLSIEQDTLV